MQSKEILRRLKAQRNPKTVAGMARFGINPRYAYGISIPTLRGSARQAGCARLWLMTTNDNLNTLRFYQKRGFVLVSVHRNAVMKSRQLKPEIPLTGNDGIPLRDEIELEMILD